jgi:hypothetical protein
MVRLCLVLGFFSTSVFAHPGHGALEIHWHVEDLLALVALGVAIVAFVVYVVKKKKQR